jgi:hypothetical protein
MHKQWGEIIHIAWALDVLWDSLKFNMHPTENLLINVTLWLSVKVYRDSTFYENRNGEPTPSNERKARDLNTHWPLTTRAINSIRFATHPEKWGPRYHLSLVWICCNQKNALQHGLPRAVFRLCEKTSYIQQTPQHPQAISTQCPWRWRMALEFSCFLSTCANIVQSPSILEGKILHEHTVT